MTNMTKEKSTNNKVEQSSNQDKLLSQILERVNKLEEENKQLKEGKQHDPKKKYDGPRTYSYKLWNGKPICDYTSKKKDLSRDYAYENKYGEVVDNHILELKLADGTTIDTLVTEFHKGYTKSEQLTPIKEEIINGKKSFVFKGEDGKEFTVKEKIIN